VGGRNQSSAIGGFIFLLSTVGAAHGALSQYSNMAPRDQYLIADQAEEIALARSAAVPSIADNAGVMVLGAHGFETAAKGTNGFVCIVERAWDKPFDDPEFWNPKMRAPICLNAAAVSTVLPTYLERAEWALSGLSKSEMEGRSKTSSKANMTPAAGAMSFMLSKQQYLSDDGGHWYPHVMFFSPHVAPEAWGANLKGSPVLGSDGQPGHDVLHSGEEVVGWHARGLPGARGFRRSPSALKGNPRSDLYIGRAAAAPFDSPAREFRSQFRVTVL
jgi:hypothetical protein